MGIFDAKEDIGKPAKAGAAEFDANTKAYTVTGGGANMWAKTDAFHFVWKKMSGDATLDAEIAWPATGKTAHRKACLIVRQSLEADSPYVDAALHGDGLTSLQYREAAGEMTHEIQSNIKGPVRAASGKTGGYVSDVGGGRRRTAALRRGIDRAQTGRTVLRRPGRLLAR